MIASVMIQTLFLLVALLSSCFAKSVPIVEYDVIIIGAGPAGLSATSALSRVARKVIMFDTEEYRNGPTRNMHDVIGNDGMESLIVITRFKGADIGMSRN
jgi:ribulose 1,5-bisphosphate synthetase/thiazole synthase